MEKLRALREHLLSSTLGIEPDRLLVFVDEGRIRSMCGKDNRHFMLDYAANVVLTGSSVTASQAAFLVLEWLRDNQPDFSEHPIAFEADILDHDSADLALKVPLSETIRVTESADGFDLSLCPEPNLDEHLGAVASLVSNDRRAAP